MKLRVFKVYKILKNLIKIKKIFLKIQKLLKKNYQEHQLI